MDAADYPRDAQNEPAMPERWVEAIARAHGELAAARLRIEALERENAELKKQLAGAAPTAPIAEPFSMRAEEKRQEARGQGKKRRKQRAGRRGRIANDDKLHLADAQRDVYPAGVPEAQCQLSHVRLVWRIPAGGPALRIAYRIFRFKKQYGVIPGVLGRSEFGLEIVVTLAFLIQSMGLSFDKACLVMGFLQNVKLRKSQADALLRQLTNCWRDEFEILCMLAANSLVLHADETSWSINSVWAFVSEKARLLFFGVHKDGATLQKIIDPEKFAGLVFSDDAAVYGHFSNAQKCWAHLLRKAIKLTLQEPQRAAYRDFADRLLTIYHEARRIQRDGRLRVATRTRKVDKLLDDLFDLCGLVLLREPERAGPEHDYQGLAREILRLAMAKELFTFVVAESVPQPNGVIPPLDGTNNEAERTLRNPAQARKTGRTSKTIAGARRTTILTSVLESLRLYLPTYTLGSVLAEITTWQETGRSCFRKLMETLGLTLPKDSVLDSVLPDPVPVPTG